MKPQEVITIMADMGAKGTDQSSIEKMHPELDQFFDKGMYIEKVVQSCLEDGRCMLTFIFRYYNTSQSKAN